MQKEIPCNRNVSCFCSNFAITLCVSYIIVCMLAPKHRILADEKKDDGTKSCVICPIFGCVLPSTRVPNPV